MTSSTLNFQIIITETDTDSDPIISFSHTVEIVIFLTRTLFHVETVLKFF